VRGQTESAVAADAAAKGWQTEAVSEGSYRVQRYRGTTGGVT
jgi:hypothetical protein